MEDDNLVHAIQKFRPEVMSQFGQHGFLHQIVSGSFGLAAELEDPLRSNVRGHDDDRILEVDDAALPISQASVIEDLQQHIKSVVMRLLDFVKENHRVRPASYGLRQLA